MQTWMRIKNYHAIVSTLPLDAHCTPRIGYLELSTVEIYGCGLRKKFTFKAIKNEARRHDQSTCSFSLSSQSVTLKNMRWIVCTVEITLYEANTSIAWFLYTWIPWVLWFLKTWIAWFLNSWILWFLSTLIPWFISIKGCIFARVWVEPLFPFKAAKVNEKQTTKRVELETRKKQTKKPFHCCLWKLSALGEISEQSSRKPPLWRDPVLVIFHCKGLLTQPASWWLLVEPCEAPQTQTPQ